MLQIEKLLVYVYIFAIWHCFLGAAPYSPGQEDMDTTEQVVDSKSNSKLNSEPYKPEDEGGYDPADPVISVPSTSSKHTSSPSALPEVSLLTGIVINCYHKETGFKCNVSPTSMFLMRFFCFANKASS